MSKITGAVTRKGHYISGINAVDCVSVKGAGGAYYNIIHS